MENLNGEIHLNGEIQMKSIGKFTWILWGILCAAAMIWVILSLAEVLSQNLAENPTYHRYNILAMMMENLNS